MTYLPTVRNMIDDKTKEKICTAKWTFETVEYGRHSYVNEANICPFSFLVDPPILVSCITILRLLHLEEDVGAWKEIAIFTHAWDLGQIQPDQLPVIFGWTPPSPSETS